MPHRLRASALGAAAVLALAAPTALPAHAPAFRVVRTLGPGVVRNDASRNMLVYWTGKPTFPVSLVMTPRAGCGNAVVSCPTITDKLTKKAGNDPATFTWGCLNPARASALMRYDVQLIAAKGGKTQKYPYRWVCEGS
jgi:hypothetical protein